MLVVLILLVVNVVAIKRDDCEDRIFDNIRAYYSGLDSWPINMRQVLNAIKTGDDWQICEEDILPRICVLDYMYGQILDNFRYSESFENDLKKIGYIAQALEDKCVTRNIAPGLNNNL